MMERRPDFRRMVVGLPHSAADYQAVRFTAKLADMLGVDLVATLIEEEGLVDLASLPCVRELRPLGGGWHPIDAGQLAQGFERTSELARRLFDEAARTVNVATSFNLVRGSIAEILSSQSGPDDILVVIEPSNPAERVTHQFTQLLNVALRVHASVLFVPSRIVRHVGPVVALARSGHDASIRAADAIATTLKERIVVVIPPGAATDVDIVRLASGGIRIETAWNLAGLVDVADVAAMLLPTNERLVVLSRGLLADDGVVTMLASIRGVPVLITGPAGEEYSKHNRALPG